jgi:hypothetical protein
MLLLMLLGYLAIIVVAVVVDVRTGSGYGLGILSALLLACTISVVALVTLTDQSHPPMIAYQYSANVLLVFYFFPAVYAMLGALVGAVIVASRARRWLWIIGFVVAAVVPFLVAALPYSLADLSTEYVVRQIGFLGVLVAPEALILAYSITRLAHRAASAGDRRPASPKDLLIGWPR